MRIVTRHLPGRTGPGAVALGSSRPWLALAMAGAGALAAAALGVVTVRVGVSAGAALLIGIGLAVFVAARRANGLIAGVAVLLLFPYWYGKGGFTFMHLALALVAVTVVSAIAMRRERLRWTMVDFAVLALLVSAGLDWWLRGESVTAGRAIADTVMPLGFYFGARLMRGGEARAVLWTLVVTATLASLVLFYEFAKGAPLFTPSANYTWDALQGNFFRPGGAFSSPPAAVTILSMVTLAGLALLSETRGRQRFALCTCLAVMTAGGILTFTRAGWIGFGVGCIVYFAAIRWRGGLRLPRALRFVPVIALFVVLALPAVYQTTWFQQGVQRGGTFATRQSYWAVAEPLIADSPQHLLLGRGLNSLITAQRSELGGVQASFAMAPDLTSFGTHNQYIDTLLEQGLVGLVLVLLWLGGALLYGLRRLVTIPPADRRLVAGLMAAAVSCLVVSSADTTFRDENSFAIVALVTGLLIALCRPARRRAT